MGDPAPSGPITFKFPPDKNPVHTPIIASPNIPVKTMSPVQTETKPIPAQTEANPISVQTKANPISAQDNRESYKDKLLNLFGEVASQKIYSCQSNDIQDPSTNNSKMEIQDSGPTETEDGAGLDIPVWWRVESLVPAMQKHPDS